MAETLVSVKKAGNAAGRSKGKKHYIYLFLWEDVAKFTRTMTTLLLQLFLLKKAKNLSVFMPHLRVLKYGILLPVMLMLRDIFIM